MRRNLLSDIDALGTRLQVLNTLLVPLLVALVALGVFVMRGRRRAARRPEEPAMRTRHLVILIVAAASRSSRRCGRAQLREAEHPTSADTLLVPGLEAVINDVERVSVKGRRTPRVTLERGTDAWTIREKGGYPADTGQGAQAPHRSRAVPAARAEDVERRTLRRPRRRGSRRRPPARRRQARGARPQATRGETKPGTLVELKATVEERGVRVHRRQHARAARPAPTCARLAMRRAGSRAAISSVDADPLNWLDRQIMNVAANRIQQVTIRHPDGETLVISKETREAPNYTVHDVPAKREVKYASVGNPLASTLASLRLDDIAHGRGERDPAVHAPIEVEYRTFDGLVVTAQTYVEDDKHYVHFATAFDEAQAQRFYVAPATATPPADEAAADRCRGRADAGDAHGRATAADDAAGAPAPARRPRDAACRCRMLPPPPRRPPSPTSSPCARPRPRR